MITGSDFEVIKVREEEEEQGEQVLPSVATSTSNLLALADFNLDGCM